MLQKYTVYINFTWINIGKDLPFDLFLLSYLHGLTVINSLELIDQGYVIVSGPPVDSSSSAGASKLSNMPMISGCSPQAPRNVYSRPSAPVPIMGPATSKVGCVGSLDSHTSAHGTSQGSVDIADTLEKPSTDCMRRIESLQCCASAITELVNEKVTHSSSTLLGK